MSSQVLTILGLREMNLKWLKPFSPFISACLFARCDLIVKVWQIYQIDHDKLSEYSEGIYFGIGKNDMSEIYQ